MNARLSRRILIFALSALASPAAAAVLTFDSMGVGGNNPVPQDYGDNIGAPSSNPSYSYGTTYGNTPDITATYAPAPPATNTLVFWGVGAFGDRNNVLYKPDNSGASDANYSITLTGDVDHKVLLESLDLAGQHGFSPTLTQLKVIVDGTPHVVDTNVAVSNSSHNTYDFTAAPYTGSIIQIYLDGSGNVSDFGHIAIDNIAFAELAPEPVSSGLLACLSLPLLCAAFGCNRRPVRFPC